MPLNVCYQSTERMDIKMVSNIDQKCNNNALLISYSMETRYPDDHNYFIYRVPDTEFKTELSSLFLLIHTHNFQKQLLSEDLTRSWLEVHLKKS